MPPIQQSFSNFYSRIVNDLQSRLSFCSARLSDYKAYLHEKQILRSERRTHYEAALVLVQRFPELLSPGDEFPYSLFGIHSWQLDALPSINVPPIDVAFPSQGFFFSFLPEEGDVTYKSRRISNVRSTDVASASLQKPELQLLESGHVTPTFSSRRILEEVFRRRLRLSQDLSPLLPIFINPCLLVTLKDDEQLSAYIDHCWHKALDWGMKQLPPLPENLEDVRIKPTSWMSRRLFLEESSYSSLFI